MSTTKEQLEKLEKEINDELYRQCTTEKWERGPTTDGVVNEDAYLSKSPRMLWILKEAWAEPDMESYPGWSLTKDIDENGIDSKRGALTTIAYVTYSVLNGFLCYKEMDYATEDPAIGDSLKCIALVNIKKYQGGKISNPGEIASHYQKNRLMLLKQIEGINPNVIIGGNTLSLFFSDFGLDSSVFSKDRTARFCKIGQRLYIDAYHPAQYSIPLEKYVDDIVQIIKENGPYQTN